MDTVIEYYHHLLALETVDVSALNNLGNTLKNQGYIAEAIVCYEKALSSHPKIPELHNNLGNALLLQSRYQEAILRYRQALKINSKYVDAWVNLGNTYKAQNKFAEAKKCYQQALSLKPQEARIYNNLGELCREQGQLTEAIQYYNKAIRLCPQLAGAHTNLGNALHQKGQWQQALACNRHALTLEISPVTYSNLLFMLNYRTDIKPVDVFVEHQRFGQQFTPVISTDLFSGKTAPSRLKIGYVSADFCQHSVAYFIEAILAHHDASQVEVYCYYNKVKQDTVTERLQRYAHHWFECAGLSETHLAEQIRRDEINILVDLGGHTAHNRLLTFAQKPAPIQVSYLGYPNTTGLPTMDYRLVDDYVEPPNSGEVLSTETLIYLTPSYFCYRPIEASPPVNSLPALRKGYVTFGSFNNFCKLNPELFAMWATILHTVPRSKLFLKAKSLNDADTCRTVRQCFSQLGIAADRLILKSHTPTTISHLQHYHQIDIALDSYPYNGATTTCEALWMGVPVITLVGQTHAARVGLSLLSTLGLQHCITYSSEEYSQQCTQLATHLDELQAQRQSLRQTMQNSPLLDAETFTRQLENHYRTVWQQWCHHIEKH